jgi:hypothetical protein
VPYRSHADLPSTYAGGGGGGSGSGGRGGVHMHGYVHQHVLTNQCIRGNDGNVPF